MYRTQMCLGTGKRFGISITDQITLFHETGFEAYFLNWERGMNLAEIKAALASVLPMNTQN